jgi:branched-chain amino acid transport system ATP-binding protein
MAAILDTFPVLKLKLHKHGGELSGGEQQTVAIGRCLMGAPKILLMDEPSLGLAPRVIAQLAEAISNVRAEWGTTLLVAEQSIGLAVSLASRCHVLQRGRVVYSGPPDQDVLHEEVRRAYLGGSAEQ